ncbi:hypothetical protein BGX23_003322 [Mortierella sp. AD031]|nr:hypothetical protein BGX23_003322 [Mortierella sp. AD031]KAG0210148.1 hypothetical protein BGX33_005105 [Mortierella sp. NVP41]
MTEQNRAENLPLEYKLVSDEQVSLAYAIEIQEYIESEAASLKNLVFRQQVAPELFLGCYLRHQQDHDEDKTSTDNGDNNDDSTLVGYIVSTLASGDRLTHASMSSHDPNGDAVCIHSVCVSKAFQRRGIATKMLRQYLLHLQQISASRRASDAGTPIMKRVLLIVHEHYIGLYAGVGFVLVGKSDVEHGPDPWFEMVYTLDQQ